MVTSRVRAGIVAPHAHAPIANLACPDIELPFGFWRFVQWLDAAVQPHIAAPRFAAGGLWVDQRGVETSQ